MFFIRRVFRSLFLVLVVAATLTIVSCGGGAATGDNNEQLALNLLRIEPTTEIPILDGKATTIGVYVHNYSDIVIKNINYYSQVINDHSKAASSTTNVCQSIAAHSSCLLPLVIPAVAANSGGSLLITAYFNGQQSKQLVNYHYVNSQDYTGVNFGSNLQLGIPIDNKGQYITAYVFGGKHQEFRQVGFYSDDDEINLLNKLNFKQLDIATDRVIPLEINIAGKISGNKIQITTDTGDPSNRFQLGSGELATFAKQSSSASILQISLMPNSIANIVMSQIPVMNTTSESTVTLTILNNGVTAANNLNLTSSSSNIVVATATVKPCGSSLVSGSSCNYLLNLNPQNISGNGNALIMLNYNNGLESVTMTQTAYILNNPQFPMLIVGNLSTNILAYAGNTIFYNDVTINNTGGAVIESLVFNFRSTNNVFAGPVITSNNCPSSLAAGGSCKLSISATAGNSAATGYAYLEINGYSAGQSYYFVSKESKLRIAALTVVAYITDDLGNNIYRCLINSDGSMQNCAISNGAAAGSIWTPYMISSSNATNSIYITNNQSGGNLYRCGIASDTSNLANCIAGNNGMAASAQPTGIAVNGSYSYVLDFHNAVVYRCNIIESTGALTGCSQTGSGLNSFLNSRIYNIAFNESRAYVTDPYYDNVYVAPLNSDGTLGAFSIAQNGISAYGITFNTALNGVTYAYVASIGTLDYHVYQCTITANSGVLTNCTNAISSGEPSGWEPSSVAFYNNTAYVTDEGNNKIAICPLNNNGSFTSCSESGVGVSSWNPHSMTILQYYNN